MTSPSPGRAPENHGITPSSGGGRQNSTPTPSLKKWSHRWQRADTAGDMTDMGLDDEEDEAMSALPGSSHGNGTGGGAWWKIRLFRGMINDVRRRAPYYASDWTDAWNYRVVPATVYMYFAK